MNLVGGGSTAGMPSTSSAIRVRDATTGDREFVMALVPRLVASSPAHWRNPGKVRKAYIDVIDGVLHADRSDTELLVAEDRANTRLGLVLLAAATHGYMRDRHAYVAQIALVAHDSEAADELTQQLEQIADEWVRSRGFQILPSSLFWDVHAADPRYGEGKRLGPIDARMMVMRGHRIGRIGKL